MKKILIISISVVVSLCFIGAAMYFIITNDALYGINKITVEDEKIVISQSLGGYKIGGVIGYRVSANAEDTVIYESEKPKSADFLGENLVSVIITAYNKNEAFTSGFYKKFCTVNKIGDYNIIVTSIPDDSSYMLVIGTNKEVDYKEKEYQKISLFQNITVETAKK